MTSEKTIHLTPSELADIVADAVARALTRRPAPLSAAEKQKAYRERKQTETVTEKVTRNGETVTDVTEKVTQPSPPPPLSPTPPIPSAPTPVPLRVPTREAAAKKRESTAELTARNCREAAAEPLPVTLNASAPFRAAWVVWCNHRAALAKLQPSKQWTALAARMTLADCDRHGAELAVMAITAAVGNGWQGLFWDRLAPAPNGKPLPRTTVPVEPNKWRTK